MSFAIPGAFPPPADKADRRVVAGHDGCLTAELFREPKVNFPLLVRVMVTSQDHTVWLAADRTSGTLRAEEQGDQKVMKLYVPPGELPPGSYRVWLWVRSPERPLEDRKVPQVLTQFTVPDTPFTAIAFSSYKPLGDIAGLIASNLREKGILDDVVAAADADNFWSYWEP
jgi:hypothetical protein